jgi:hypothetical protein
LERNLCQEKEKGPYRSHGLGSRVARFFLVHDTKNEKSVPNEHKMYLMVKNIPNGLKIYVSTFSNLRPSEIYPNWDFWLPDGYLATLLGSFFLVDGMISFLLPCFYSAPEATRRSAFEVLQ